MKQKYPKKIIIDYLYGNDIEGYDIDKLGEDPSFMTQVIKTSKDKRIYNLCSEEVKTNYEFVKFLVIFLKKDKQFIEEVANYYLSKTDKNDITHIELTIILNNILPKNDFDFFEYKLKAKAFYIEKIALIAESLKEKNSKLGYGFIIFKEKYQDSDIVKEYIAKQLLFDIFYNETKNNIKLEELIHIYYKDKRELEEYGINNFIITYIRYLDEELSDYLSINPSIIAPIKKDITKIINNWDKYIERLNERRVDIIYQEVSRFTAEDEDNIPLDYYSILDNIIIKLKLEKLFGINQNKNNYNDLFTPAGTIPLKQMEFEKKIYNLIKELFKMDYIPEDCSDYCVVKKSKKKHKRTIIPFKPTK